MTKIEETRGRKPLREGDPTVRYTVRVPASVLEELTRQAHEYGEPVSALVRRLMERQAARRS